MNDREKDAMRSLEHGARFPYDASDHWWDADDYVGDPPQATDWAHRAARGVVADLLDRRGIKDGLRRDRIDERTRHSIVMSIAMIIRMAAVGVDAVEIDDWQAKMIDAAQSATPAAFEAGLGKGEPVENTDLAKVREYAIRLRTIATMYEDMEAMARKPDSHLAPILAFTGQTVVDRMSKNAALLECLFAILEKKDKPDG